MEKKQGFLCKFKNYSLIIMLELVMLINVGVHLGRLDYDILYYIPEQINNQSSKKVVPNIKGHIFFFKKYLFSLVWCNISHFPLWPRADICSKLDIVFFFFISHVVTVLLLFRLLFFEC